MAEIRGNFKSFKAATDYFGQKVNLPTKTWRDITQGQHTRAFVVAGVTSDFMLADFREAVDAAISSGESLEQFRKRFDDIVARNGWAHNGSRNWRSNVIYQTNMRTAYMAGRWQTLQGFPYLRYQHNTAVNPREEHQAWHGLVIARDDPWWETHYPPNGWGCRCSVTGVSDVRLKQLKPGGPDSAPPAGDGDPPTEWAYHVGHADTGRAVADPVLAKALDEQWTAVPGQTPADFGRPDQVPADEPSAKLSSEIGADSAVRVWDELYGQSTVVRDPSGAEIVLSRAVLEHWLESPKRLDGREKYLPLLREVIESPFEVWVSWAKNGRGRVGLRRYYVKVIKDKGNRALTAIAQVEPGGVWSTFDLFRGNRPQPSTRQGLLVWGRPLPSGP